MQNTKIDKSLLHTFAIDFTSEIDNKRYLGEFTVKRMSISDFAALGVRKSQLNGGMHHDEKHPGMGVDADTDEINAILAHLDICIKKAPDWWNLNEIADVQLVYNLYQEVMNFENSFRGFTNNDDSGDDADGEGDSQGTGASSNTVGTVAKVVGAEVPATLEP